MVSESFVNILASGITASLAIIVGALFFNAVRGGVKIPLIFGKKYVSKGLAFLAFLVSIYVVGWFSTWIEIKIKDFLIQNQTNVLLGVIIPLILFYLVFNCLFYKRK